MTDRILILVAIVKDDAEHTEATRLNTMRNFENDIGAKVLGYSWLDHKPNENELYTHIEDHLEDLLQK